ncbi:outer membrane protein assembly factor BamB family protein [Microtetraspora malaysiensis]|uniref:outer membrane protein assembly factor BamB family protein n=1 Tax=Microtetraspora malaysiensis TaxID=161358 RepID=UPI000B0AECAC|nr:PQQ-binding-like beta-propeller repeat protein [Microtetraspora malaysiensis]
MTEQHTGDPYGDRPAPSPWGPQYQSQPGQPMDPSYQSQPSAGMWPNPPAGDPQSPYGQQIPQGHPQFPPPPGQPVDPRYQQQPMQPPPPGYSPQPPQGYAQAPQGYAQAPYQSQVSAPYPQQMPPEYAQPPYAQQGPPEYAQPQYAQQGPPGYPQQAGPEGPAKKKGKTTLLVALGLVVLLAAGGGTAWFVARGGPGGGGGASAGGTAWDVPLPNAGSGDFTSGYAYGTWMTDTAVIRAQRDGVLAYDLKSGARAWGIPSPGEELCGATPELKDGKGAVAYGASGLCDHLTGLDTATGKLTWKIKIPAEKSKLANARTVPRIMSAGGMAILYVDRALYGYRLSDGHGVWGLKSDATCSVKDVNANGNSVAVLLTCYNSSSSTNVAVLDAATGKLVRKHEIGDVGLMGAVLSAEPTIIGREESDGNVFAVLDSKPEKSVEIKAGKVDMLAMNRVAYIDGALEQRRYAVHGNRLYLATFAENVPGKMRSEDKALAFDLTTGKQLWQSSGTHDTRLTYVRADDRGLLALEAGDRRDLAPRLVRLDAATGAATSVAELPQKYGTDGEGARVFERNGTVVIVPWTSVATKFSVICVDTKED